MAKLSASQLRRLIYVRAAANAFLREAERLEDQVVEEFGPGTFTVSGADEDIEVFVYQPNYTSGLKAQVRYATDK